jgi:hypothetical protein
MPLHVERTISANVEATRIWNVLKDFSNVQNYSAAVRTSPLLEGPRYGLGTRRRCSLHDATSVVEEIVEFSEGHGFRVRLSEFSLPMKTLEVVMRVRSTGAGSSEITMGLDFEPKGGLLGRILGNVMMKPMLRKMILGNLRGLAYFSSTGIPVDRKLPVEAERQSALVA